MIPYLPTDIQNLKIFQSVISEQKNKYVRICDNNSNSI